MSILDQYFQIFSEGASDQQFRQRAIDIGRRVQVALRNIPVAKLGVSKGPEKNIVVNIGELLTDPELTDLDIHFVKKVENVEAGKKNLDRRAQFKGGTVSSPNKRIEIYVELPPDVVSKLTPEKWKGLVASHGEKIMDRAKELFWHEFIHYMDYNRIHPQDPKRRSQVFKKKGDDKKSYFNNPLELNAFIQQGLSRVENHLTSVGSRAEVMKVIGKSADEFYKTMLKLLSPGFAKNLTDQNKNKLKKRVAQMWTDTMKRFGG